MDVALFRLFLPIFRQTAFARRFKAGCLFIFFYKRYDSACAAFSARHPKSQCPQIRSSYYLSCPTAGFIGKQDFLSSVYKSQRFSAVWHQKWPAPCRRRPFPGLTGPGKEGTIETRKCWREITHGRKKSPHPVCPQPDGLYAYRKSAYCALHLPHCQKAQRHLYPAH